jgi:two-component system, NtrC family, sensor kinase
MTDATPTAQVPQEDVTLRVDKALLGRPGFSFRARLALVFLLFFVIGAGTTVATWIILSQLQTRLGFLETADQFNNEILQARRFEKNFFLYGTNLDDVLQHIDEAHRHLASSKVEFGSIVGLASLERLESHLDRYRQLAHGLGGLDALSPAEREQRVAEIEGRLRVDGKELVSAALELAERERSRVRTLLAVSKGVPAAFLLCILLLSAYSALFFSRHIIGRLNRLLDLTRRIGEGDLSPIVPARKYRDEFTHLVVALNHMLHEMEHRHQMMIRSHKLRAVGRLTAGVAHELNNPINNIMLTAAVLREDYQDLSDGDRMEMVDDLMEQAQRSRRIVRNLLEFAREGEVEPQRIEIEGLVAESLALVANQLKLARITPAVDVPSGLPPIHGDRQHLSQVLVNLILNSVDAMPKGGRLTVTAESEGEGASIVIHVRDTGSGIPSPLLGSIFDPFFTTKPTGKGTGLGLSVSLAIARRHGGDIRVHSQDGVGSTFSLVLPTRPAPRLGEEKAI